MQDKAGSKDLEAIKVKLSELHITNRDNRHNASQRAGLTGKGKHTGTPDCWFGFFIISLQVSHTPYKPSSRTAETKEL